MSHAGHRLNKIEVKLMQAANSYIYKIKPYTPGKPIDEVRRELGLKSVITESYFVFWQEMQIQYYFEVKLWLYCFSKFDC